MKITLPLPPNMANSRMHWRVKNRERKAYIQRCQVDADMYWEDWEEVDAVPYEKTGITATIYHTHTMDQDNSVARLKWPVDWMKRGLWIVDDDPDHLVWTGFPTQVKCKKDERRVEFVLEAA